VRPQPLSGVRVPGVSAAVLCKGFFPCWLDKEPGEISQIRIFIKKWPFAVSGAKFWKETLLDEKNHDIRSSFAGYRIRINGLSPTGFEFYVRCQQVGINSVDPMFQTIQSLVYEWIKQEYRNVPDAMQLSSWVLEAVRKNGWGNRELKDICLDVALENGMMKPK